MKLLKMKTGESQYYSEVKKELTAVWPGAIPQKPLPVPPKLSRRITRSPEGATCFPLAYLLQAYGIDLLDLVFEFPLGGDDAYTGFPDIAIAPTHSTEYAWTQEVVAAIVEGKRERSQWSFRLANAYPEVLMNSLLALAHNYSRNPYEMPTDTENWYTFDTLLVFHNLFNAVRVRATPQYVEAFYKERELPAESMEVLRYPDEHHFKGINLTTKPNILAAMLSHLKTVSELK